jgi:hypothetical protein
LSGINHLRKHLGFSYRKICKLSSIKLNTSSAESMHEFRIAHAVRSGRRVDSCYPELPEISFLSPAITICELAGSKDGFNS